MLELNQLPGCIDVCNLALKVDPENVKCLMRKGIAHHRLRMPREARGFLEKALEEVGKQLEKKEERSDAEVSDLEGCKRRIEVYLLHSKVSDRKAKRTEKKMSAAIGSRELYKDKKKLEEQVEKKTVDDSDEAIMLELEKLRS